MGVICAFSSKFLQQNQRIKPYFCARIPNFETDTKNSLQYVEYSSSAIEDFHWIFEKTLSVVYPSIVVEQERKREALPPRGVHATASRLIRAPGPPRNEKSSDHDQYTTSSFNPVAWLTDAEKISETGQSEIKHRFLFDSSPVIPSTGIPECCIISYHSWFDDDFVHQILIIMVSL